MWPWQFRHDDKDGATSCNPKLLMGIKLTHYFTLVAQGSLSWMLFAARDFLVSGQWKVAVPGVVAPVGVTMTELEVFLLVLGSVYQAAAGGFFIMAHEYDGWEIGRFRWPEDAAGVEQQQGDGISSSSPAKQFNNDRLRLVAYQLLWMFQGLGMGTAAYALHGALARAGVPLFSAATSLLASVPPALMPVAVGFIPAALLTAWFGLTPWEPNRSFGILKSQDAARMPLVSLVVFIIAATWFAFTLYQLVGPIALPAVVCFSAGGLTEAIGAEGEMDQWFHLAAVVIISTGSLLLMFGIHGVAHVALPWLDAAGQGGLSAAGWWYVWLGVAAAVMIAKAEKADKPSA